MGVGSTGGGRRAAVSPGGGAAPGRPGARSEVLAALAAGRSVLVLAHPGSGSARVVRDVVDALGDERRTRLWWGDHERLDRDQAARLADEIDRGLTSALIVVGTDHPLPPSSPLERLRRDGALHTVLLPALSAAETLAMMEDELGGRLDPDAVPAFVPRRPGGDPSVLLDALQHATRSAMLVLIDGTWRLAGVPVPDPDLQNSIWAHLARRSELSPPARLIVEALALAPEITAGSARSILVQLTPPGSDPDAASAASIALERLEESGVIEAVGAVGEPRLRLRDPAVELVLPRVLGVLRRRRIETAVVDVLAAVPVESLPPAELIALERYALELGRDPHPPALLRASAAALQTGSAPLALQLAAAAARYGSGAEAQLAMAAAESQLGRTEDAVARLRALRGDPASGTGSDHLAERLVSLERLVVERGTQSGFGWDLPGAAPVDPDALDPSALQLLTAAGDGATAAAVPDAAGDASATALLEGGRLAQAASNATLAGRLTEAAAHLDAAEAVLAAVGADTRRVDLGRHRVAAWDGATLAAVDAVRRHRGELAARGQAPLQAVCCFELGELLGFAGQPAEAAAEFREALAIMARIGMEPTAMMARAEYVVSLAQLGDLDTAQAELDLALGAPDDGWYVVGAAQQGLGWLLAARGDLAGAAAAFLRAADIHAGHGHELVTLCALAEAARAGAATAVLARVEVLADRVEGANCAVQARHVRALARLERLGPPDLPDLPGPPGPGLGPEHDVELDFGRDTVAGAERASLAHEFDATGAEAIAAAQCLLAAECYTVAARLHAESGSPRAASASARRAAEQFGVCGIPASPFAAPADADRLSEREREIAVLAAAGFSNRQIADRLVVSIRTVETHLLRVYRKLGLRGRTELAGVVDAPPAMRLIPPGAG